MAEENYYKLLLKNMSSHAEELVSQFCFEHGASGIAEDLAFDQSDDAFNVKTLKSESHNLTVYFETRPQEEFFLRLQAEFPQIETEFIIEENKDWMAEWKKGFKSFELCPDAWVVPSWEKAPENIKHIIRIDPGMAFGTGTHETTQVVASLLNELPTQKSLLDVGTGTGIIAMLAHHLGYEKVEATEIDELARQVARENFSRNKMPIHLPDEQVGHFEGQYDVVVANIIDGVFVQIQEELLGHLKPGGILILSGILIERDPAFKEKFAAFQKGEVLQRLIRGEWVGYVLQM